MKEMSDLICGKAAVGGNYNSTRDNKDSKVKAGTDEETLKELIINTYTTILARGIKGCYVYAYNKNMQKYLKKFIIPANEVTLEKKL